MAGSGTARRYGKVFDEIAAEYDRRRPAYPDALIGQACQVDIVIGCLGRGCRARHGEKEREEAAVRQPDQASGPSRRLAMMIIAALGHGVGMLVPVRLGNIDCITPAGGGTRTLWMGMIIRPTGESSQRKPSQYRACIGDAHSLSLSDR